MARNTLTRCSDYKCRSQWPRRLSCESEPALLWVWIPPMAWMSVSVVSVVVVRQRSLRRADHSSRRVLPSVVCLTKCDLEALIMRRPWPTRGFRATAGGLIIKVAVYTDFIVQSVLRQVHSLFQIEFSTECEIVLPFPVYSIFSCP
jgi:hypothetical protein